MGSSKKVNFSFECNSIGVMKKEVKLPGSFRNLCSFILIISQLTSLSSFTVLAGSQVATLEVLRDHYPLK